MYAELVSRREGITAGDDVFTALEHDAGVISHLWATATAAIAAPLFRVLGSAGAFVKSGLDVQEVQLRAGEHPGSASWGLDSVNEHGRLSDGEAVRRIGTSQGRWDAYYRSVACAVETNAALPVPLDSVAYASAVLAAAQSAAANRKVVTLPDPQEVLDVD